MSVPVVESGATSPEPPAARSMTSLYGQVMCCPLRCSDVVRDECTHVPRGFFTLAAPGDPVRLMVVALNPGQPSVAETDAYAVNSSVRDAADSRVAAHLAHAKGAFLGAAGGTFHRRLVAWLAEALHTTAHDVFRHAVYTNLVKCTTRANAVPKPATRQACHAAHLSREIAAWRPSVVVALGRVVASELVRLGIDHAQLPHPSHREGADHHRPFVRALQERLDAQRHRR